MSHTTKKQRLDDHQGDTVAVFNEFVASFDDLSVDVLANVLGFLQLYEIMRSRRINKKTREAVKMTIVPPTDFRVRSMNNYNAMRVMTRAMPNLQQITIGERGRGHKWSDGEDPNDHQHTADWPTQDIAIISNFSKLRILTIDMNIYLLPDVNASMNGRYPFLFNSFPLLQKLSIDCCYHLKWDLEMLAGFPMLTELECKYNQYYMTGNIRSLRVLKETLEKLHIHCCRYVEGNFMDIADFPHLKELNLEGTDVTGDIRDIGENDFSSLEELDLPDGVYGGNGYELQRISDAPDVARAVYLLNKQRPALKMKNWCGGLSEDSPDWYESADEFHTPPFDVVFVKAGSRLGYRWVTGDGDNPSEVNWLDPEPESGSIGYEDYLADYNRIQGEISLYRGYYEPPTEEQYTLLYEEYFAEMDDEDY